MERSNTRPAGTPAERPLKSLRPALFAGPTRRRLHPFYLAAGRGLRRALHAAAVVSFGAALLISFPAPVYPQAEILSGSEASAPDDFGATGNLDEQIPKRYRARYNRWKAAFLSVEFGRQLWSRYAANPAFRLTIIVSKSKGRGGDVNNYIWDKGRLVGATISLGHQFDQGCPERTYYPVLGSLPYMRARWCDEGDDVLAAAKIAHEFGHVDDIANTDAATVQLQKALSPFYVSHFLSNGYDIDDPVLIELAGRMGGTPLAIVKEREFWADTYALRFLLGKLKAGSRRELLRWVQKSLESGPPY